MFYYIFTIIVTVNAVSALRIEVPKDALTRYRVQPNHTYTTFHSQSGEDQHALEHYFHGREHGTYLEIGGLDGITYSNTAYFSRRLGWRGVLIEANPSEFEKLIENRPNDYAINAAVCSHIRDVHFISAHAVGGIWEFFPQTFKQRWHKSTTEEDVAKLPAVTCAPLSDLLSFVGMTRFDFFSLDVEGAELEVLSTLDFERFHANVIVVEADEHSEEKNQRVRELLTRNGYEHQPQGRNDWFVHRYFMPSNRP